MRVLYNPGKATVVGYALTLMTMGSVAHLEEGKKELVRDINRLVRLGVR